MRIDLSAVGGVGALELESPDRLYGFKMGLGERRLDLQAVDIAAG